MARPNRELLTGGKKYKDSKKLKNRVNEVIFDKEKRKDYLTGFHKRKLERKKKAQDYLEEQAKKDRLEERAKIREERKLQVQKKLAEMQEALELNPFLDKNLDSSDEEGDDDDDDDDEDEDEDAKSGEDESDAENKNVKFSDDVEWSGFDNDDDDDDTNKDKKKGTNKKNKKGILKKQIYEIENEDAPVSGTSEVVIESLDNPNSLDLSSITKKMNVDMSKAGDVLNSSIVRAKKYARLMGMSETATDDDAKVGKPKQKKKKFRYLSKTERKVNNLKIKQKKRKRFEKD